MHNPWNVTSAAEFLKYCCPECEFQSSDLHGFSQHAVSNHILSNILFDEKIPTESETQDTKPNILTETEEHYWSESENFGVPEIESDENIEKDVKIEGESNYKQD